MNINNLASLYEGYFWLSRPSEFNDPFDCNKNLIDDSEFEMVQPHGDSANSWNDLGVTCFSESITESIMWAHYTNNYHGFALEFDVNKLQILIDTNRKRSLNPVVYLDKFVKMKSDHQVAYEYMLTAKSANWIYEKEWRLIADVDEEIDYNRLVFYTPESVKSLYVGYQ